MDELFKLSIVSRINQDIETFSQWITELQVAIDGYEAIINSLPDNEFTALVKRVLTATVNDFKARQTLLQAVIDQLEDLKKKFDDRSRATGIIFLNESGEEITKMDIQIDKNKNASIKIVDKGGNDAKVDGLPVWELDAEFAALEVAADGMSAKLVPTGKIGVATLKVKADADMGEGVEELAAELELAFLPGKAVGILLSVTDAEVPAEG